MGKNSVSEINLAKRLNSLSFTDAFKVGSKKE